MAGCSLVMLQKCSMRIWSKSPSSVQAAWRSPRRRGIVREGRYESGAEIQTKCQNSGEASKEKCPYSLLLLSGCSQKCFGPKRANFKIPKRSSRLVRGVGGGVGTSPRVAAEVRAGGAAPPPSRPGWFRCEEAPRDAERGNRGGCSSEIALAGIILTFS